MNTNSVQDAKLDMLKGGGTYSYHFAVKVEVKRECAGAQPAVSCNGGRANLLFIASD